MFSTGKVVVLDISFCVFKATIVLLEHGVSVSTLINKRRHWPARVKGDKTNACYLDKPIGYQDSQTCALMEKEWKFVMKEAVHNLMMMTTHGSLACDDDSRINTRARDDATFEFKHSEVIDNHCGNCGSADDHNDKWHDSRNGFGMSLEKTWNTTRWEITFFLYYFYVRSK